VSASLISLIAQFVDPALLLVNQEIVSHTATLKTGGQMERCVTKAEITKLFDEHDIAMRIDELARMAAARLPSDFVVVGLLVGSFVFIADLIRALYRAGTNPSVEFIRLASYGLGRVSSGNPRLIGETELDLAGRAVLLIDDIVDTGRTLLYARNLLLEKKAASVLTCALVDKPSRREVAIDADFVGFTAPDVFIVGYGIDYANQYRQLPFIGMIA
jgi:hypoxanthine phosphoribosyltransferase